MSRKWAIAQTSCTRWSPDTGSISTKSDGWALRSPCVRGLLHQAIGRLYHHHRVQVAAHRTGPDVLHAGQEGGAQQDLRRSARRDGLGGQVEASILWRVADAQGQVALLWLILAYFLHTTGELCLSPVGLSMVTRLSVPRVVGLMMGVWFLSSSVAHYVAGGIAAMASVSGGADAAGQDSLSVYVEAFTLVTEVALVTGVVVLLLAPFLRKRMHLAKIGQQTEDPASSSAEGSQDEKRESS